MISIKIITSFFFNIRRCNSILGKFKDLQIKNLPPGNHSTKKDKKFTFKKDVKDALPTRLKPL